MLLAVLSPENLQNSHKQHHPLGAKCSEHEPVRGHFIFRPHQLRCKTTQNTQRQSNCCRFALQEHMGNAFQTRFPLTEGKKMTFQLY